MRLLSKLDNVRAALAPVLAAAAAHTPPEYAATMGSTSKGAVLLMCINWGNLDLMLNFLRSACHRDIDVRNLVVFAADDKVEAALKAVGVHTFSHAALGQFDANAARSYGDHTFVEMMWLKLTCVYLVNDLGYDLLFQDADLYWWRAPWAYFEPSALATSQLDPIGGPSAGGTEVLVLGRGFRRLGGTPARRQRLCAVARRCSRSLSLHDAAPRSRARAHRRGLRHRCDHGLRRVVHRSLLHFRRR